MAEMLLRHILSYLMKSGENSGSSTNPIRLELPRYRTARVWLDQLPDALVRTETVRVYRIPAAGRSAAKRTSAAIEWLIPCGARFMYGMSGGRLEPTKSEPLSVEINVSADRQRVFAGTLRPY